MWGRYASPFDGIIVWGDVDDRCLGGDNMLYNGNIAGGIVPFDIDIMEG